MGEETDFRAGGSALYTLCLCEMFGEGLQVFSGKYWELFRLKHFNI